MDLVIHTLHGIGSNFKEIVVALRARDTPPTFDELYDKLASYDDYLQRSAAMSHSPLAHSTARQPRGSPGGHQRQCTNPRPASILGPMPKGPRPTSSFATPSSSGRPIYQYCQCMGHTAKTCYRIHPELRPN
ncbi:unnamed protein product [Linum trigynum]|uniref:Uncharacterized protein n=1 Tax=Linum trigynum TaxID=586398 RepID=A0AAV2D5W5_9ROSI